MQAPFDVAFLSHTAMGGSLVVGSHHFARTMATSGKRVLHLSAPLSIVHFGLALSQPFIRQRIGKWLAGGELVGGAYDVAPFTLLPWQVARLSQHATDWYSRILLPAPYGGLETLRLGEAGCLIVDEPRFVGLVKKYAKTPMIYRATDLYSVMRNDGRILEAERALCQRARAIVATSEPVAQHLRTISGRSVHVITNGVDYEHFSSPAAPAGPPLPGSRQQRAIYVGAFDGRFGTQALRAAVHSLPTIQFLLVGPGSTQVMQSIVASNVHALGAVPYRALPALMQQCSVGLLPLSSDASNAGRSPMKLYEYAAAGLAIAATSTEEIRHRELPAMFLANTDEEFPQAVSEALKCSSSNARLAASRSISQRQSWREKTRQLLALTGHSMP